MYKLFFPQDALLNELGAQSLPRVTASRCDWCGPQGPLAVMKNSSDGFCTLSEEEVLRIAAVQVGAGDWTASRLNWLAKGRSERRLQTLLNHLPGWPIAALNEMLLTMLIVKRGGALPLPVTAPSELSNNT